MLDDKKYSERIFIRDATRHEGITLEARKGACIELPLAHKDAITIANVPNVTIRGFRFCAHPKLPPINPTEVAPPTFVRVEGYCSGVLLEKLKIKTVAHVTGIIIINTPIKQDQTPIKVLNCEIETEALGVMVDGAPLTPAKRVVVAENRIKAMKGITLNWCVTNVQVTNNLVYGCAWTNLELNILKKMKGKILIANNTLFRGGMGIRIWNNPMKGGFEFCKDQVILRNNLLHGSNIADIAHVKVNLGNIQAQEARFLLNLWEFGQNYRDLLGESSKLLPLAPNDRKLQGQPFESLVFDAPNFLRPKQKSALATEGAGKTDPAFPTYVGAVAPEGKQTWHWKWTWDNYFNKTLTVSQDPKDAAQFQNINAALKKVQPGMTIRVLDKGPYREQINIADAQRHKGITLEAVKQATIELLPNLSHAIQIYGVHDVKVRNFRFVSKDHSANIDKKYTVTFVVIKRKSPGVQLQDLDMKTRDLVGGILVIQSNVDEKDPPVVISRCTMQVGGYGVYLAGLPVRPVSNVLVCDNRVDSVKGITVEMDARNIQITGNFVRNGTFANFEFYDLLLSSKNILIANNTFVEGHTSLRF